MSAYTSILRIEEFYTFIREREAIRQRRVAGLPYPWTTDPILGKFSFTNVKREHDRTSRLLREEFYTPHFDAPKGEILFNCTVARYFGTIEFMRAVDWTTEDELQDPEAVLSYLRGIARNRLAAGQQVFTGAYIITSGGVSGPKEDYVCNVVLRALIAHRFRVVQASQTRSRWQDAIEELQKVQGFGGTGFMAKEVISDTRYTSFWPIINGHQTPSDTNTWTPVGPGGMRGAAAVAGKPYGESLGKTETVDVCLALFAARKEHWPMGYPELELHDIQFQLCEFFKYEKVRFGHGRPRSLYKPSIP